MLSIGFKVCAIRDSANWTLVRDKDSTAPYIFNRERWVGFDDEISVKLKVCFWLPFEDR